MRSGRIQSGLSHPGIDLNGETLLGLKGEGIPPDQERTWPSGPTFHQSLYPYGLARQRGTPKRPLVYGVISE